jgi:hypothetical protein
MTTSQIEVESLLAIDVGSVHTRALLFDVADGRYHFVAEGQAPSTTGAPFMDISEGVRLAVERLHEITGRVLIGSDEGVILPSRPDGSGVDALVATTSAGPVHNLVAVGLLENVSLESAQRLVTSTYGRLAETIWMNDHRTMEAQVDAIIQARPHVIILAGGTEGGASRSVMKLVETVGLACYLIPQESRPTVLYSGNQALEDKVKSSLEGIATVKSSPNIRPGFDVEDLGPAQEILAEVVEQVRTRNLKGVQSLGSLSTGGVKLSSNAFGRVVRFLSRINDPHKGVLGVDVGGSSTVVAAGHCGRLSLGVHHLGVGESITEILEQCRVGEIVRWLPMYVPEGTVVDYIHHKRLYPGTLPVTAEDMAIEQAIARQVLRVALRQSQQGIASLTQKNGGGPTLQFEPILATGAVLSQAPTAGQSLMMLLDSIQPVGITTFVVDQYNLTSALGAAAEVNSLLPVQVFESGAFLFLGTVVSPISEARYGTPILNVRMVREDKTETQIEVTQGSFHMIPLPRGQSGQLILEPLSRTHLGLNRQVKGVKVTGGALGAVIDARGRPLSLPEDDARRREMIKKWIWTLGG